MLAKERILYRDEEGSLASSVAKEGSLNGARASDESVMNSYKIPSDVSQQGKPIPIDADQ